MPGRTRDGLMTVKVVTVDLAIQLEQLAFLLQLPDATKAAR